MSTIYSFVFISQSGLHDLIHMLTLDKPGVKLKAYWSSGLR